MYLNRKINSPKYAGSGPLALHNLTREFLFLSQNARTRHAAESCIDVLRAANALLGYDCYSWQNTDASHSTFQDMKCSSSHTLVLSGGIFEPWVLDAAERTAARECLRNAARVCTIGSAVFVPLNRFGGDLLSHTLRCSTIGAQRCLTSGFGMGPGVSLVL